MILYQQRPIEKSSIIKSESTIYLIPTFLHEEGLQALPSYLLNAVKKCSVFFVENERSARRYLKLLDNQIVIDDYEWFTTGKAESNVLQQFRQKINDGKNIGIFSEAGCPGIADPGQLLVAVAQEMNARVIPLTGPSSILLALMASGMNGQQFSFVGYLPIDNQQRFKEIKELETRSKKEKSTQIFIETPYRNNQLLESLLKICQPQTKICVAANLTGPDEWIQTKTVSQWKKEPADLHKKPVIFLLHSHST